jgi:hypothetical protein
MELVTPRALPWVGWTLALFLVAIAALDPLWCADGCTHRDVIATGQSSSGPDCPLCQPSSIARPSPSRTPLAVMAGRTLVRSDRVPAAAFFRLPEHPPRRLS